MKNRLSFGLVLVLSLVFSIFAPIKSNAQAILGQYPTTGQTLVGVTGSVPLFAATFNSIFSRDFKASDSAALNSIGLGVAGSEALSL